MALILEDISYTYERAATLETVALSGVGLRVELGELVLVLGATGSGKSTLLRIAAGLLEPASGRATIDAEALDARSARGRVGLVFQDAESQLFADTLLGDVAFGPTNLGATPDEATARAQGALRAVGLDPEQFGSRSPFALSGGEARRAAIAGVLAMEPDYLLADEPTAGLDPRGRRAVIAALLGARERSGLVVVSHSAEEFLPYATTVLLLSDGAASWSGPAAGLVGDPSPLAAAGLIAPGVLRVQELARESSGYAGPFSLDPDEAARGLAAAAGWSA